MWPGVQSREAMRVGGDDKPFRVVNAAWKQYRRVMGDDQLDDFGFAIRTIQEGRMPNEIEWAQLKGVGTPPIFELKSSDADSTYRVMIVVLPYGVYLLHAFKKKSTRGIKTALADVTLAVARRALAEEYDTAIAAGLPTPTQITTLTRE